MEKINSKSLLENLGQFTGTCQYYRINPKILLTDGTFYLAEQTGAFWLMTVFASHLVELNPEDCFAVLKLNVDGFASTVTIEDGNDTLLATQKIEFTDFPLSSVTLYGCSDGKQWVLMLPSEY